MAMFCPNVGGIDRLLRIGLGAIFFVAGLVLLTGKFSVGLILIGLGVVVLVTGILRFCALYVPFGFSTARTSSTQICDCDAWFNKMDGEHRRP